MSVCLYIRCASIASVIHLLERDETFLSSCANAREDLLKVEESVRGGVGVRRPHF